MEEIDRSRTLIIQTNRRRVELRDEAIASLLRVDTRQSQSEGLSPQRTLWGDIDVDSQFRWVSYVNIDEQTVISKLNSDDAPLSMSLSRCNLAHEAKRAMEAFRRMREDASSEMSTLEQADMLRTQNEFLNQLEGAL